MLRQKKEWLWPILTLTLCGALIYGYSRASIRVRPAHPINTKSGSQNSVPSQTRGEDSYVRQAALMPQLRWSLKALGDRLEKRGKERLTLTGTLTQAGESQSTPFVAIREFSDRLRLTFQAGAQTRVLTFNGQRSQGTQGGPNSSDEDLIETMLYDTAEHFFISQMQGAATRSLGSRFRAIEDSRANYSGPFYDIFEVTEPVRSRSDAREETRQYCFDSDTHLLEVVKYGVLRNGLETRVEVRLTGWYQIDGQRFPGRIVRSENGTPVVTLILSSVTTGPGLDDGPFN